MSVNTKIEWTDVSWNPVTGCSKVSSGCKFCYAERVMKRWKMQDFGDIVLHHSRVDQPLHWKKPRKIFVNSMSDLFHDNVPAEFIGKVFDVMAQTNRHTFIILTKRPERMRIIMQDQVDLDRHLGGPAQYPLLNVWLGVSVEDQKTADERIPILMETPAAVRFISYEPALGSVDISDYTPIPPDLPDVDPGRPGLDWVICGGESGPNARPFDLEWARDAMAKCKKAGVPFFMKQMGSLPYLSRFGCECWPDDKPMIKHESGCFLKFKDPKGGVMLEWPRDLMVREFPK